MYVSGRRRRGVGAVDPATATIFSTAPGSSGHGVCSAAYWNFNPLALFDNACKYPAPPAPAAPTTVLVPNGGIDVAGNPTYDVVTQTPQENQAQYAAEVAAFMDQVGTANPPPDCTSFFNKYFNSACPPVPPGDPSTWNWILLAVVGVGLVGVAVMSGGRR